MQRLKEGYAWGHVRCSQLVLDFFPQNFAGWFQEVKMKIQNNHMTGCYPLKQVNCSKCMYIAALS